MCAGGAAAAADDIEEAGGGEFLDHHGHFRRRFVVFAEGVRQAGVGVGRDMSVGLGRQFLDVRPHSLAPRAQFRPTEIGRACRTEFQKASVVWPDRVRPEASVMVPEIMIGSSTPSLEHALDGEDRRLGVEGVEDGLDQDQVGAAFDQAAGRLDVVLHQFVEGDVAVAGVVHVREIEQVRLVGPSTPATKRGLSGVSAVRVRHLAGQARPFDVEFVGQRLHAVVGLGHLGGVEGVGLEDVGAGVEVGLLDGLDHVRAAQQQEVVVAFTSLGQSAKRSPR